MKILIAGFGSIGRRHFRNLLDLGERDILFYRTGHSTLPASEVQGFPVETDLQAALAHRPQAVIITNPTALHLEVAIPAARAGCHLLLEKPLSNTLDGLDELKTAVMEGGGKALVGFQFRYHPGLRKARSLLADGAIGRPLSARAHWGEYLPGWHPWEDYRQSYSARSDLGGGVVLTLTHPLDYLRWLMGEIEALWAFTGHISDLDLDVDDVAEIGLRFASRALGTVHLDYLQRPPAHRLEIVGSEGTIRWDNAGGAVQVFQAGEDRWLSYPAPAGFDRNLLFIDQMRHFLEVAQGLAEPLCTLDDGIRAVQLAIAVHQSQAHGKLIEV